MAIDPSIPLKIMLPNFLEDEAKRQQILSMQQQRDERRSTSARNDEYRSALGDVLSGNGGFAAEQRAQQADPESYVQFQGAQSEIASRKLRAYRDLNDTAMQILSGVHDQASYDQARQVAGQLYSQHGMNLDELGLPDQYSPEVVQDLRMRGMDTHQQLQTIAQEHKLDWDMADDQADNERADASQRALSGYRQQRLATTRREQDLVDARTRRGQDMSSADRKAAVKQRSEAAKARGSGKSVSPGDGAIIRNPKTGERMKLQGGKWVPIG